ncbi:MAG: DoxX family protein [Candidatus Neomarinimicrobiota bacterium]|nr:MAG: DoxX family protein [Candidatus Neomarinimicrobiota bacterium]
MKNNKFIVIAAYAVRFILGFLFLYASIDNMINPAKFAGIIYHYRVLPIELLNIVAILIPWVEAVLGVTLLLGIWIETSTLILSFVTLFFIVLMISAIVRGLNIECGCFSFDPEGSLISWKRVIEDVFMLIGSMFLFFGMQSARN